MLQILYQSVYVTTKEGGRYTVNKAHMKVGSVQTIVQKMDGLCVESGE